MLHVRAAGETFGNAAAEFSHLGVPVVTTFSGACAHRTILSPAGGGLVVVTNAAELLAAVVARPGSAGLLPPPPPGLVAPPRGVTALSPYGAFSPTRVGRRLLELVDLGLALRRRRTRTRTRTGLAVGGGHSEGGGARGAVTLAITRPASGRVLVAGDDLRAPPPTQAAWAASLRVDVGLDATDPAALASLPPADGWRLCLSLRGASSFVEPHAHLEPPPAGVECVRVVSGQSVPHLHIPAALLYPRGNASVGREEAAAAAAATAAAAGRRLVPLELTATLFSGEGGSVIAEARSVVLCPTKFQELALGTDPALALK